MSSTNKPAHSADDLVEAYAGNPFVRALARLFPGGSSADVLLTYRADQIRNHKARIFFDRLSSGSIQLSEELIESNDFLHCFFSTASAAFRARRDEKVAAFANLLRAEIRQPTRDFDDFDELVGIVDELSHREWLALSLLETFQDGPINQGESPLARIASVWADFAAALEQGLGIVRHETSAFMNRTARTGLYEPIMGSFWDYEGGLGTLSPRYYRLKLALEAGQKD